MGEQTKIEWCHHTFNPWRGCAKVSPGCANCYAEKNSLRNPGVFGTWGIHGERIVGTDSYWKQPLAWNRAAEKAGERRRVFVASLADVMEDRRDLDASRERLCDLIRATPWLDWLLLTKRPENIERLWRDPCQNRPNLWWGVSAENQEMADLRIPILLRVNAAVRFVSIEPMLAPVRPILATGTFDVRVGVYPATGQTAGPYGGASVRCIDWIIVGGESGPGARPCDVAWVRAIVAQCKEAGVPCFVKQLGRHVIIDPAELPTGYASFTARGRDVAPPYRAQPGDWIGLAHPKGGCPGEWPEDLRVREFPVDATVHLG